MKNAGLISFHFRKAVHFEHPDDPAQHTARLTRSDGVLLVWGNADEEWCSREFAEIVQTSTGSRASGLCLFEPANRRRPPCSTSAAASATCSSGSSTAASIRPDSQLFSIPFCGARRRAERELRRRRRAAAAARDALPGPAPLRDRRIAPVLRPRPAGRRAGAAPGASPVPGGARRVRERQVLAHSRRPDPGAPARTRLQKPVRAGARWSPGRQALRSGVWPPISSGRGWTGRPCVRAAMD